MASRAASLRLRITGTAAMRKAVGKITDRRTLEHLLGISGIRLQQMLKREFLSGQAVRVVTGRYRDSIQIQQAGHRFVDVGTHEPRATMLEFATPSAAKRRARKKGKAVSRAAARKRSHFRPALARIKKQLPAVWADELARITSPRLNQ